MTGIRKMFAGAAVPTTLNGAISGVATSIVVTNALSFPDGSGGKFVICIDRGLATEEKILITSKAGNTFTAFTRGYDGTVAQAHANAAVVEHVLDADTIDQANRLANLLTAKGDLYVRDATDVQRVAVGANDARLVADSTQTLGVRWAPGVEQKLVDAKGDLLAGSADDTLAKLTVGANDTRLVADSAQATGLRWAPDTENKLVDVKGDLLVASAADTLIRKAVGNDRSFLMADAASAGGVKWNTGALSTWTLAVTQGVNVTFGANITGWTRVGRMVTAMFYLSVTGAGTAATIITINLPVNADAGWILDDGLHGVAHWNDVSLGNAHDAAVVIGTATTMKFRLLTSNSGNAFYGVDAPVSAALAAGDILSGTVTYAAAGD